MTVPWSDAASVIEVAKGILMERRGCAPDEAFGLLRDAARAHDMSVSDLAECVVADRDLRPAAPYIPRLAPETGHDATSSPDPGGH